MVSIYFFWFSWIAWIVFTFFYRKPKIWWPIFPLLLIISTNFTFSLDFVDISLTFILLLLGGLLYFRKARTIEQLYYLIVAIIITTATMSYQLFYLFDPVIAIIDPAWMLASIIVGLTLLLVSQRNARYAIYCVSLCLGEIVYSLFLHSIYGKQFIGSAFFLDVLAIGVLLLYLWNGLEYITNMLAQYFKKYTTPVEN